MKVSVSYSSATVVFPFFLFNDPATTEIYTLSLHDALPICENPAQTRPLPAPASPPRCRRRYRPQTARRSAFPGSRSDRSEEHTLNSSHANISYAVFCLKKNNHNDMQHELPRVCPHTTSTHQ